MQGFAGVFVVTVLPTEPMWTGFSFLQVCGKTDLFRAQVWWGDNGARRVERHSPSASLPDQWDQLRHCFSHDHLAALPDQSFAFVLTAGTTSERGVGLELKYYNRPKTDGMDGSKWLRVCKNAFANSCYDF